MNFLERYMRALRFDGHIALTNVNCGEISNPKGGTQFLSPIITRVFKLYAGSMK